MLRFQRLHAPSAALGQFRKGWKPVIRGARHRRPDLLVERLRIAAALPAMSRRNLANGLFVIPSRHRRRSWQPVCATHRTRRLRRRLSNAASSSGGITGGSSPNCFARSASSPAWASSPRAHGLSAIWLRGLKKWLGLFRADEITASLQTGCCPFGAKYQIGVEDTSTARPANEHIGLRYQDHTKQQSKPSSVAVRCANGLEAVERVATAVLFLPTRSRSGRWFMEGAATGARQGRTTGLKRFPRLPQFPPKLTDAAA